MMNEDLFIKHLASGHAHPAFTDEVGTGAIMGPAAACAVTIPVPFYNEEVDDSKRLPPETIRRLAPELKRKVVYGIGLVSSEEINTLHNTWAAGRIAMIRALQELQTKAPVDALFIDGKFPLGIINPEYPVIKGDAKVFGIAIASIIAKDFRDRLVVSQYGEKYSRYHISSNKGYRSPDHLLAIRKWGCTKEHRSYLPQIQQVLSRRYDRIIQTKYQDRWDKL